MAEGTKVYKQPRILTRVLLALIIFQIFSAVIVGGVVCAAIIRGENIEMPSEIFAVYDLIRRSLFFTPLTIVVLKMFWIYRMNKNTHAITAQKMEFTPGWSVGWHFVPIASLWYPYMVMSELYRANRNPDTWKGDKPPLVIGIWWIMNVILSIVGSIVNIASKSNPDMPMSISAILLLALAAQQAMAFYIYNRIAGFQQRNRNTMGVERMF